MNNPQIALLLDIFAENAAHQWESIDSALEGAGEAEAAWSSPAYAGAEPDLDGMPAPGSVLWQVAHLALCNAHYAAILRQRRTGGGAKDEPDTPAPAGSTLAELRESLREARAALADEIARMTDDDLAQPCPRAMNWGEFLRMVMRHDAWHAGQIALARRLWREQGPGRDESGAGGRQ